MKRSLLPIALTTALMSDVSGSAQSFIVEPVVTCCGVLPDNIYAPGTVGGPALYGGVALGVDAISYGHLPAVAGLPEVYFSVSAASVGGGMDDVFTESFFSEHQADIFASSGDGMQSIVFDGDGMSPSGGAVPALGLTEGPGAFDDNVNALDMRSSSPTGLIYFSVDPFTAFAYGGPPFGSPAHVYVAAADDGYDAVAGPAVIYATAAALGLVAGDDIDALTVYDDGDGVFGPFDVVRFSLTPLSPSLGIGAGPADIFEVAGFGALPTVATTAAALGLLATDDLDAIDSPEPGRLPLGVGGVLALAFLVRRRSRRKSRAGQ